MGEEQKTEVAMKGDGYYSLATKGAKDVIDAATPLVHSALAEMMQAQEKRVFTLSDMGCADGGTSLRMIGDIIKLLRKRSPAQPIMMVYSDQPRNDYNALFRIIHGLTDFESYLATVDNVHVMASATSFYDQIIPAGTLDLGFSATAMHWLSRKPCDITEHVHMVGAGGDELSNFAEQGKRDWETILLHRAAELVSGGRLVLINFGRDEAGNYLGNTGGINMFDTFNQIWQHYLADGVIESAEYIAMTLPQYYNTVEEFSAPLLNESNPVYQAGLRLESIETRIVPCPFASEFAVHGDARRFAKDYIPTLRSWTESTFFGALSQQRPELERREIIQQFYNTYEDRVAANPDGHAMDYVHAYMVISKN